MPAAVLGVGWVEAHRDGVTAGHDDIGLVGVIGRLKHHHAVARIDKGQHDVAQHFGGAAGNTDLGQWVDFAPGPVHPSGRNRLAQAG